MRHQILDRVCQFALACWVLGVLLFGVLVLLLGSYCTQPPVLTGSP
jgi:hypothetical protein